ncbi:LysE family transporter [Thalassovita mediterranea]|jgi:threonine/homoserine/homoserine lactone efflux protein|uniref:Homoserine/Threonine efflux protein n=1 Tax=Thalassovita mediterranea TaxID=340021 RepID=A0A0P1GQL3_9RHOB|nr:LysE family transporter [Thalassovita mediterranea]CUH84752.1 homoserine/Threonine efflux protein [Thalassovita mediterranea]SIS32488.1 Threonine/homoserine/homoserine lactone efflux protein [Thalassovita mediterranea]
MGEVLLTGLLAGVAIAAPVGPIGLLCIRRSIVAGRGAGLATGLGAAAADGTYGLAVATGIAASGLVAHYGDQMQIFGGVLLLLIGLNTARGFWRARPNAVASNGGGSLISAFASTYLLTLSNPMTMLAFVAMIAGLGQAAGSYTFAPIVLVAGVFLGSALWWLFLVQLALWARQRINGNALRWLDLLSGSAISLWGLSMLL